MAIRDEWMKKKQTGALPKGRWVALGDGTEIWVPAPKLVVTLVASGE